MKYHCNYKGCIIYMNAEPNKMKYSSYCAGLFISSDTLLGIKMRISKMLDAWKKNLI